MNNNFEKNSRDYWDKRFETDWDSLGGPNQSSFFAHVALENIPDWFKNLAREEVFQICDWGCAEGDGTDVLASYFGYENVIGVDFSQKAIETASRRYPNIKFSAEDWTTSGSNLSQFGVVFSSNTLEHFAHPYKILEMLAEHTSKFIVLLLPYKEAERVSEHNYSFFPDNIPCLQNPDLFLIHAKVANTGLDIHSPWHGQQIVLIYARRSAMESIASLHLADIHLASEYYEPASTELKALISERDQMIVERDQMIIEQEQRIIEREQRIAERNQMIAERDQLIAEHNNQIQKLLATLAVRNEQVSTLNQQVKDLLLSTSWKVTAPLRFTKDLIRSPKEAYYRVAEYFFYKLPSSMQPNSKIRSRILNRPNRLISIIANQFSVSEKFVRLYRERIQGPMDWSSRTWEDFFKSLPPLQKLSVPFAMSTVVRGRTMLSLLQTKSVLRRRNRYLDIGTGYGGFLRAAHEMGFKETVGIELQPLLVELSNANVDGIQGAQVITGDFIKEDFSRLGSFDLITCNDVIEHVDDAALAIQKMCALLNEDGCLAFEVPNKDCIASVKADGHFLIFGITQLPKEKAARYYAAHTGAAEQVYNFEMGEMYELPWYIEQLEKNSLTAFIADTHCVGRIEEVPSFIADLEEAYKEWQELVKPALDIAVAEWITSSVEVYMKKLKSDFSDLSDEKTRAEFTNRYLRLFWTIIATKTS